MNKEDLGMLRPYEEYVQELALDKHRLDDAIEKQATLYNEIATSLAFAISARDEKKRLIEESAAIISAAIREEAKEAGKKITENGVTEQLNMNDDYLAAHQEFLDAKQDVELWSALKESFAQRGYMIRELAQLYIAGYFAEQSYSSAKTVVEEVQVDKARETAASNRRPLKTRQ